MTNDEGNPNAQMTKQRSGGGRHDSDFVIPSTLDMGHSSLLEGLIANAAQLAGVVRQIESADRVAVDTEADSLHSYREKLCLLQINVPAPDTAAGVADAGPRLSPGYEPERAVCDYIIDPLADIDLEPLRRALEAKEIVLHGADYDLRMLRRGLNLAASKIFDTMIAARLLGIREFSLAAFLKRYFGLTLLKGS